MTAVGHRPILVQLDELKASQAAKCLTSVMLTHISHISHISHLALSAPRLPSCSRAVGWRCDTDTHTLNFVSAQTRLSSSMRQISSPAHHKPRSAQQLGRENVSSCILLCTLQCKQVVLYSSMCFFHRFLEYLSTWRSPGCKMWIIKMRVNDDGFAGAGWRWEGCATSLRLSRCPMRWDESTLRGQNRGRNKI